MPEYHVRSEHAIEIAAPRAVVYDVLKATSFRSHPVVLLLMGLRMLPALLCSPRETLARLRSRRATRHPASFAVLDAFAVLEDAPGDEIVLGLTGSFWRMTGGLVPTHTATFRDPIPPGLARAAWSFRVVELGPSSTRLVTETRVLCADGAARRSFLRYWRVVAPGSGLIRLSMLSTIRRRAEALTPS